MIVYLLVVLKSISLIILITKFIFRNLKNQKVINNQKYKVNNKNNNDKNKNTNEHYNKMYKFL